MNKNEENLMQSEKNRQETVRSLGDLGHTVGCVIRFTLMFNGFMMRKRSYGGGEKLTLVELMLLLTISESEGIFATEIAKKWRKTKGAISQILKKLETKGLIDKQRDSHDAKMYGLFLTERGRQIIEEFDQQDTVESPVILEKMREEFTEEQINNFYCVMRKYTEILTDV